MSEKSFNCSHCARSFGRLEHQKRHELIHLREKPFHCVTCSRGFTRRDALQRHEATHAEQYTSLLQRGARACLSCATARVKCSGSQPCERCERRGWPCAYPSDDAAGETLAVEPPYENLDEGLSTTLGNTQQSGGYLEFPPRQETYEHDFWDPSILASTNWLDCVDLDAFDPTLSEYGVASTLRQPSRRRSPSVRDSPRSCLIASSPVLTVTTGTTSTDHDRHTEAGEYYVDGQPARLPRVKRRRASRAIPTARRAQVAWSLQEPALAGEGERFMTLDIGSDSHENLSQLYRQLCLAPGCLYQPFENGELPSKTFFENLIVRTFASVVPIIPFFHHSHIVESQLHWLEVIALASLACHFADIERKHEFAISMHEFVRRLIHWVDEQPQPVQGLDSFVLARVMVMHTIGATYCGDNRLCRHALGLNARLTSIFHELSRLHNKQCDNVRGSTDRTFVTWRDQESSTRLMYTIWLNDSMTAYQFQKRSSLGLSDANFPLPCQEKLWSVRNEKEWLSVRESSAIVLSLPPTLMEAMQQLYVDKWLPRERGEFARVLMIHALFQRSWEVEDYYKTPLSHWEPSAQRQQSTEVLPSEAIWLPSIPAFTKWQNTACDALDILHWQANATIGQSSGLEHSTVLHLHVARIVLLAPYIDIVAQAQHMTGTSVTKASEAIYNLHTANLSKPSNPTALSIRRWATNNQYKARLAAIHAGVAFWHVRRYSTDAYYEAPSVALAALTLWAFGSYARQQPSAQSQGMDNTSLSEGHRQQPTTPDDGYNDDDLEPCSIILLDRPTDDELVQQFIKNGDRMEAHISGIGDLYAPQSPRLVLKHACKLLKQSEKSWGIAGRWLNLLEQLSELST